jgi:hypothetical protein
MHGTVNLKLGLHILLQFCTCVGVLKQCLLLTAKCVLFLYINLSYNKRQNSDITTQSTSARFTYFKTYSNCYSGQKVMIDGAEQETVRTLAFIVIRNGPYEPEHHKLVNRYEPCVLYIGRAHRYPPNTPFYIFFQQIHVLNFLNMRHTLRFFLFKMPFISQCYLFCFLYYLHFYIQGVLKFKCQIPGPKG